MGSISNLSSSYLQSVVNNALQGIKTQASDNGLNAINAFPSAQPDNSQLSPFTQLLSTLQQLQQSDPTQYQQLTQQIATNLQSAAQTAQANGNTTSANQLNQLAEDFSDASTSGQLPNVKDLATAIGSPHHHHHHFHAASSDTDNDASGNNASGTATSNTNQVLNQLLSAFQANATTQESLNPMNIIFNTLSNAGITGS